MQTTTLGRGGPIVSRLGLGLAALGRPGYINLGHANDLSHDYAVATMEARAHAVLEIPAGTCERSGVREGDKLVLGD